MSDADPVPTTAGILRALLRGDEHFAVTGASGWFGRTALALLVRVLGPEAFRTRVTAFASTAKDVRLADGTTVHAHPLDAAALRSDAVTHLLHYAFLTRDRVADLGVDSFVAGNVAITATVLELMAHAPLRGMAYASSGAARSGAMSDNPYGALKRIDELAFRQACRENGASCCVARVFATSGAYMTKPERYALGEFILTATRDDVVRVTARHPVLRSYAAAEDVVALHVASILQPGRRDDFFETGGEEIEMYDLARRVTRVLGREDVAVVQAEERTQACDRYIGDPTAMQALAKEFGFRLAPLDEQIRATAAWFCAAPAPPPKPF